MAAVHFCQPPLGGADRLPDKDEAVRSSADLAGESEHIGRVAEAVGALPIAIRTTLREALSLSGPQLAGIHVRDPARTTGSTNPATIFNAPRACWDRSRRNLE